MIDKEKYKKIFKILKEELNICNVFNSFNRNVVIGIASSDAYPRTGDSLDIILTELNNYKLKFWCDSDVCLSDIESSKDFIKSNVKETSSFRFHHINIPEYDTIIDYFVLLDENIDSKDEAQANTIIIDHIDDTTGRVGIYATILIREHHGCITDDSFGKILKHEITHVVLSHVLKNSDLLQMWDESDEFHVFEEFLCDYIQWDASILPNEDPVGKFKEMAIKYLTNTAREKYEPYVEVVSDYYLELKSGQLCEK